LTDNEVVTATMSLRNGILTNDKFVLLGDTTYTIERSLTDQTWSCSDSKTGTLTAQEFTRSIWASTPTDYKIIAGKNGAKFYWKMHAGSTWTLLGTSSKGIGTVKGIQFGGKGESGESYCYLQFDSIHVTKGLPIPTFNPADKYISGSSTVAISSEIEGAKIYYTLDGTTPTAENGSLYHEPVSVTPGTKLSAIAVLEGNADSDVAQITYSDRNSNSVVINEGVPYVNGKPFLTIGLYHSGDPIIDIINEETPGTLTRDGLFSDLADRGFNTVFYSWNAAPDDFYKAAQTYGLMVVSESRENLSGVSDVVNEPNIFGWYGLDEPTVDKTAECVELYNVYKNLDPIHPVMTAFCNSDLTSYGTDKFVDIAMPDPYPFKNSTTNLSTIVPERIQGCRNDLLKNDPATCVIYIPQLFTADGAWNGYIPTYNQVRAEVYTALHYGAKGIFYYALYTHETLSAGMPLNSNRKHWYLPESELWNEIASLNNELLMLKDVILQGVVDSSVTFSNTGSALGRCLTSPGGDRYVILVNPTSVLKTGIQIQGLSSSQTLTSKFSSPTPSKTGTTWMVNLNGYGVGVYMIHSSMNGDANSDGCVDVGDLGILAANYGGSNKTWSQGDFNGDGIVDVGDLGILAANYGTGSSSASDFNADYAKVFDSTTQSSISDDSTENDSENALCSSLGLSLIAGLILMGLMIVKLEK
jgi:hypothetical protein